MLKWITSYIDYYIYVCTIFLVYNDKNICKVKSTKSKKLYNLRPNNVGNISKTTHGPEKVVFNFSIYRLNNYEKTLLWKGLNFVISFKTIKYSDYLLPFKL